MVASQQNWPDWLQWELDCSNPHLVKRMIDRRFNETDLRQMLEDATGYHADATPGRWVIETTHEQRVWEVIVQPDDTAQAGRRDGISGITMSKPYLEITYRGGKAFAAYLYLDSKPGDTAARTERHGQWLVDFAADGRAIGVEFPRVGRVNLRELNRWLAAGHQPAVSVTDLGPVDAA